MERPKFNEHYEINMAQVINICEDYLDYMSEDNNKFTEDGASKFQHIIFENILSALYGEDVWKYINQRYEK